MGRQTSLEDILGVYDDVQINNEVYCEAPENKEPPVSQKLSKETVIKNISCDQSEIIHNIIKLYLNGQDTFDCDMTASTLNFYKKTKGDNYEIPVPKLLFDVYPQVDGVEKITPFNKLPIEDGGINSIMVDLPFVCSPKTCKSIRENIDGANIISKRFSSWYPMTEGYENIYWWLKECYRVLANGGVCVWKFQSSISGGLSHWMVPFSFMCAQEVGFYVEDEFILEANNRLLSGKVVNQQHARKYTSTFWVFRKNDKLAKKNNCFTLLEECKKNVYEGKVWELK